MGKEREASVNTGQTLAAALHSMRTNPLRSALTMLGIVIGVGAVIVLVALGNGMQAGFTENFSALTTLATVGKSTPTTPGTAPRPLREADIAALKKKGVDFTNVTPLRTGVSVVRNGSSQVMASVAGSTPHYLAIRDRKVVFGRSFTDKDEQDTARVALIGPTLVTYLFNGDPNAAVNAHVYIGRLMFRIVGVLEPTNDSQDNLVLVPLKASRQLLAGADTLTGIGINATSVDRLPAALSQLERIMDYQHRIGPPGSRDYSVITASGQLDQVQGFIALLTLVTVGVAGIALFVGALGVANIMLVTVTERTHEIGIRKAIGATRSAILRQFLTESVSLAGIGGLLGVAIGCCLTLFGNHFIPAFLSNLGPPRLSLWAVLVAFGSSLAIGIVAGGYPALRAAKLHPIDALRH